MSKKGFRIPHTFTIVLFVIVIAAFLTWLIPGGEFERVQTELPGGGTKEVVVPDSYHAVDHQWQSWQIFSAFYDGFLKTAHIIVFIFMIGGAFWILNYTKAIDFGIQSFLKTTRNWQQHRLFKRINVNSFIIAAIMVMFSLFGAIFGMSEETLAFMVIFVPLAISMGYDSLVGVGMCYLAAHVGFAGGMLNPFTLGIAQGLADLPAFSGLEYRFLCWIIFTLAGMLFVLWYAKRIYKHPEKSPMYQLDRYWRERMEEGQDENRESPATWTAWLLFAVLSVMAVFLSFHFPTTSVQIGQSLCVIPWIPVMSVIFILLGVVSLRKNVRLFILDLLLAAILGLIIGVLGYGWNIKEIAALFLALGICSGLAYHCGIDQIMRLFIEGCKDILSAALIVGLAGGIIVILQDGKIIDTILYAMSNAMDGSGRVASVGGMYLFQNLLNMIIPSGSAKAALTIPLMAPLSDLLDISRQTMVLAFQFGDGITNMITPASGVLIGCLGVARVPYTVWVKWIFRWLLFLFVLGFLLLIPTLFFPINGF